MKLSKQLKLKSVNLLLSLIGLSGVVFTSCEREASSDVNQDRIYTIYSLVYEGGQDVTYARSWFRFGSATGTLLELTSPSFVTFEEQDLGFNEAFAYYEKRLSGWVSEGTFIWEDYEGKSFQNSVSNYSIGFPNDLDEISGSESFELSWVGKELDYEEYVAVAVNGDFEGDATIVTEKSRGATSITLPKSILEKLPKDREATFWLEFGYNPPLQQSTGAGGEIYGKYRVSKQIMIR